MGTDVGDRTFPEPTLIDGFEQPRSLAS